MYFFESPSRDPFFNLALEERLFDAYDGGGDFFLLWQNEPSVIVGKFQNTAEEINQAYVDRCHIKVARRLSGGGAVYHDGGNLNYTFILNQKGAEEFRFDLFAQPVIRVLGRYGIAAEFSGRNDILIDGKKISGCAQFSRGDRLLYHGCILLDSNLENLAAALRVRTAKLRSNGVRSVSSRVTTVNGQAAAPIAMAEFKEALVREILREGEVEPFALSESDRREILRLRETKYATWEWNYGFCADYALSNEKRFPGGTLNVKMNVAEGRIQEIRFFGDFFGGGDIRELEARMAGLPLDARLEQALERLDISHYIHGATAGDLYDLLMH